MNNLEKNMEVFCHRCGSTDNKEQTIMGADYYKGNFYQGIANRQFCNDCGNIFLSKEQEAELHDWLEVLHKAREWKSKKNKAKEQLG